MLIYIVSLYFSFFIKNMIFSIKNMKKTKRTKKTVFFAVFFKFCFFRLKQDLKKTSPSLHELQLSPAKN